MSPINRELALKNSGYVPDSMLGRIIFPLMRVFIFWKGKSSKSNEGPYHFILFRVGALGDYVLSADFTIWLRKAFPDSFITVLGANSLDSIRPLYGSADRMMTANIIASKTLRKVFSIASAMEFWNLKAGLAKEGFNNVFVCLNRLETPLGTLKCLLFCVASSATFTFGINTRDRGRFFMFSVDDRGYLEKHETEYFLELFRLIEQKLKKHSINNALEYLPKRNYVWQVKNRTIRNMNAVRIVIHPGGGSDPTNEKWLRKRWPKKNYVKLVTTLQNTYDLDVVISGSKEEQQLAREIETGLTGKILNVAGQTSIKQIIDILLGADVFLGSDSGISHLASYLGMPTLVLFAYSDFVGFSPIGERTIVLRPEVSCSPCLYWFENRPCKGTNWQFRCVDELTVERARNAVDHLVNKFLLVSK